MYDYPAGRRRTDPIMEDRDNKYWHLDRELASLKDEQGTMRRDVGGMKADIAGIKTSMENVASAVHEALEQSRPKQQNLWQVIGGVVVLVGALAGYVQLTLAPMQVAQTQEHRRVDLAYDYLHEERQARSALAERITYREARADMTEEFLRDGLQRLRGLEINAVRPGVQ